MSHRQRLLRVLGTPIVVVAAITVLKISLAYEFGPETPFLFVALGVIVSGWFGGTASALLATLLSTLVLWYKFLPPLDTFRFDGSTKPIRILAFVIEGTLISVVTHAFQSARERERFARLRAEAAERWQATTLRSIGDAVIAADAQGRVTLLNPVAEELTQWSSQDARGRPLRDVFKIVNHETRRTLENPIEQVLREGKVVGLANHTLLLGRLGRETPIDDSGAPIRDESGRIEGVVLVFRDVSERERETANREFLHEVAVVLGSSLDYRETLSRLATLIVPRLADWAAVELVRPETGMLEQVAVWHRDPAKVELAEELCRLYPPDPKQGQGVFAVLRTGQSEFFPEIPDSFLERVAVDARHLELLRKLELGSAILAPLSVGGATFGVLTLVHAESGRHYQEADLAFVLDLARRAAVAVDNARLYAAEQRARELASSANRAKDEFLATVSHELRTPLNAIAGWTSLLARGLDERRHARAVETIERNATTMAQLVEDLLDVSRIISGKMRLDLRAMEPFDVVQAALESLRPAAESKQLELSSSLDPAAGPVLADAPRLQQVVSNLLGNAIKFTPEGGRVELSLRRREPMVEICVIDSGKGIPAAFLPHVFDAFSQADASTTRAHRGLGLGLAISRRLVEMHGGRIEAKSEGEGRGATFKVLLPALVQAELWPASMKFRAGLSAVEGKFEGLRVLVVEDDLDARDLLEEVLCSAGCSVTASSSVGDALTALQSEHPDILLSDIAMPGETGFDLIRRVRALPPENGGSIPAAALTAYASAEDRRRVLQAGFMMHVPKPVDPDELLQAVSTLVRLGHQPQPSS